jgi:molybdate transport system permease protein
MPIDYTSLRLSLFVAASSTFCVIAVGLPLARLMARKRFVGKELISALLTLPLVLPPTVLGYDLLRLLGRRGFLGGWLESHFGIMIVFNWWGVVIAAAVAAFPLFFIPARSAFEGVNVDLENAARLLGRGEWSVFKTITIPLAWRGLTAGIMLAFLRALGDFGATLMVGGNIPGRTRTAALAIYSANEAGRESEALTLTLIITGFSLGALLLVQSLDARRRGRA